MRKTFARSILFALTIMLSTAFTNHVSAQTTVDELIFGNTNKDVINFVPAGSTTIVINEVYGGGGNAGAPFNQDFVELYNKSGASIDLAGYAVQYAGATGATYSSCVISSTNTPGGTTIAAGGYFLLSFASGATGSALTGVNTTCPTGTDLAVSGGKVALTSTNTTLNGAACPPTNGTIVDFVGYGTTANCSETANAPAPSNTTSVQRFPNGSDKDNNSVDFQTTAPSPKTVNLATTPGTIQFSSPTYSVSEGTASVTITVTRTGGTDGSVSATYATSDGSATGGTACSTVGVDYLNKTGTVTFANGSAADKTFTITICNDTLVENDETVNLTLSNPTGGATLGTNNPAVLTIIDNDTAPADTTPPDTTITGNPPSLSNSSSATFSFTGTDNVGVTGFDCSFDSPTFTACTSPQTYTGLADGSHTFAVRAKDAAGNVDSSPATYTFTVDTTAPTVLSIDRASANPTVSGSTVSFTVTFSETVAGVDAGDFALVTTGVSGASITNVSGSGTTRNVTVNVGSGSGTVRLDLIDNDSIVDAAGNPLGGAGAGNGNFTGQTYDVNAAATPGTIAFTSATYTGSETGMTAVLTVQRTGGGSGAISATVDFANAGATGGVSCGTGVDYVNTQQTVSFADGDTADKTVTVTICNDTTTEGSESFTATLGGTSAVGQTSATVTITDDSTNNTVTLGNPNCQNLAGSPLRAGSTGNALMCFSLAGNNNVQFTGVLVRFTSDPTTKYANPKLVRSTDTDYATTGDNVLVTTGTVSSNGFTFTGFSQFTENGFDKASNPNLTTTPANYFVVADVLPTVDANTPSSSPSVSAADITTNPPTTVTGSQATSPAAITFAPAAPSAALVNVGGRVLTARGRGIYRVRVQMTDDSGVVRSAYTNSLGFYRFTEIEVGQTLIFNLKHKGYKFQEPTRVVSLNDELDSVNFTAY